VAWLLPLHPLRHFGQTLFAELQFQAFGHGLGTALESSRMTARHEVRILIGPCSQEKAEAAVDAALDAIDPICPASQATLSPPQDESDPDRTR
jgi:hypothetical protein